MTPSVPGLTGITSSFLHGALFISGRTKSQLTVFSCGLWTANHVVTHERSDVGSDGAGEGGPGAPCSSSSIGLAHPPKALSAPRALVCPGSGLIAALMSADLLQPTWMETDIGVIDYASLVYKPSPPS